MLLKKTRLCLLIIGIMISSCTSGNEPYTFGENFNSWKTNSKRKDHPKDMVLIYDGGAHRNINWTPNQFAPYVSYNNNDKTDQWLFDGFLFLEIIDGNGRCFASYYEKEGARQSEWKALVDNYFEKGNAVMALDEQIKKVINETSLKKPGKRKVVLCLPEPIPNQKDWGSIDGVKMDFTKKTDRLQACKWYVDYAEKCFKDANLEHLELTGFYWIAEEATNSRDLSKDVSSFIHQKGYNFYWIPYFKSDGYKDWEQLGFDKAYYQPNYFFNEDRPISQIEEACKTALSNGMGLEVEFDERALAKHGFGYRLDDYLRIFNKYGAFDSLDIAYYQGGDAFYKLYFSEDPIDNKLYNKLANIIANRQNNR